MTSIDVDFAASVRLEDPSFYLENPFPIYRRMRAECPVFWYAPRRTWALTRHDDIRWVNAHPEIFSSAYGLFLHDANKNASAVDGMWEEGGEQIGLTDPPRHTELRRIAAPAFTPKAVARLRAATERNVNSLLDAIKPGLEIEVIEALAVPLPILTACEFLGIPEANHELIRSWSDELERVITMELPPDELAQIYSNFAATAEYLEDQIERKRSNPGDDFISLLLAASLDGKNLSPANIMMFTQTMIAAGNDTTRALLSGILATLAQHPGEREKLIDDPELIPLAIEEVMRYVTPSRGFIRTLVDDAELRGQPMNKGEHVFLMYDAANRDEEVFPDPETFRVDRPENSRQLAFGHGPHVCIGAPLVRMETRVFLECLLARFPRWEITGDVTRANTVPRSAWTRLPVTFSA